MIIKQVEVGLMGVNCYIIGCKETNDAIVIDPGEDADWIIEETKKANLKIRYIVNTHGHYDHIGGNKAIKAMTGAEILIHPEDAPMLIDPLRNFSGLLGLEKQITGPAADRLIVDGDIIKVGTTVKLKVIHTPGHTPGSVSIYQNGHLFTGDTLFSYSIGRTDFPGGSFEAIMNSIFNKLLLYPDNTQIYPGHNTLATLGEVREQNPFVRQKGSL